VETTGTGKALPRFAKRQALKVGSQNTIAGPTGTPLLEWSMQCWLTDSLRRMPESEIRPERHESVDPYRSPIARPKHNHVRALYAVRGVDRSLVIDSRLMKG
jgi:hypothetical protein